MSRRIPLSMFRGDGSFITAHNIPIECDERLLRDDFYVQIIKQRNSKDLTRISKLVANELATNIKP
jgi:hypothetical protein